MASKYTENEDFLEEDQELSGQKFVLLSFLSPEKVLQDKSVFLFKNFVKDYEINYKTKKLEGFLVDFMQNYNKKLDAESNKLDAADLSGAALLVRQSKASIEQVVESLEGYVRKNTKEIETTRIQEDYDDFLFKNGTKLEDEFYALNKFRTTVRGLKVRGSYNTQEEAIARSKKLQRLDTLHNIFVGEVGKWLPWDPNPNAVKEQEYAEDELNTLMKKYKENEDARENFYREQRKTGREKTVMNMDGQAQDVGASNAAASSASSVNTVHTSLFSGPADLALERKKENAAKKEE